MEDGERLVHEHCGILFFHFNSRRDADEFYDVAVSKGLACSRYGFTVEVLHNHDDEEVTV
jgi:hypothetical protein